MAKTKKGQSNSSKSDGPKDGKPPPTKKAKMTAKNGNRGAFGPKLALSRDQWQVNRPSSKKSGKTQAQKSKKRDYRSKLRKLALPPNHLMVKRPLSMKAKKTLAQKSEKRVPSRASSPKDVSELVDLRKLISTREELQEHPPPNKKAKKTLAQKSEKRVPSRASSPKDVQPPPNKKAKKALAQKGDMRASGSKNVSQLKDLPKLALPRDQLKVNSPSSKKAKKTLAEKREKHDSNLKDETVAVVEGNKSDSGGSSGDGPWILARKVRQVSIREFSGRKKVDIRQHFEIDGEVLPGKTGISLSLQEWKKLLEMADEITRAFEM